MLIVFKQTPSTAKAYSRYKQLVFMIQKKSEDDQIDVSEAAGRLDVERGSLTLNGYLFGTPSFKKAKDLASLVSLFVSNNLSDT